MSNSPKICYLCGRPLAPPVSQDHVPPKQFYAKDVRKQHRLNLRTITVHQECNLSYQFDEDYFVNTLAPFAIGSYSGNAFLREFIQKFHSGKNRSLVSKVRKEFEARPSGLVLPPGMVAKRFEGERMYRVAWKIIRGLYFHHFNEFLPEDTPNDFKIIPPDHVPPKEFITELPDYPVRGQYPGVFDYKFKKFPELNNFNYWAMLLWDRIIMIVYFHDPSCDCDRCLEGRRERDPSAITE